MKDDEDLGDWIKRGVAILEDSGIAERLREESKDDCNCIRIGMGHPCCKCHKWIKTGEFCDCEIVKE